MAKQPLQSALLFNWRRPIPSEPGRGSWRVYQSVQLIDWRAARSSSTSGGGSVGTALAGEADGVGNAQVALVGPPETVGGEADGVGNAQIKITVRASLLGEADGIGNAQIFLGGGMVSIACITSGAVSGSPPTPQSSILYDAPASW